jgi:hypothetical protein
MGIHRVSWQKVSIWMNTHCKILFRYITYFNKLSFLFTCCKVKTLGYNKFNCSKGSFKQWQNTTIVKTNVFIEQLVNKHSCGIKLCKVLYFIRVYVKMLHRTVMTRLYNSTVHSASILWRQVFFHFIFVGTKLYKPHYKPSLPDRAETCLHPFSPSKFKLLETWVNYMTVYLHQNTDLFYLFQYTMTMRFGGFLKQKQFCLRHCNILIIYI